MEFFLPARSAAELTGFVREPRESWAKPMTIQADVAKLVDALV